MYENADDEVQRILRLVEACPETLRPKAFEILLQGFVDGINLSRTPAASAPLEIRPSKQEQVVQHDQDWTIGITPEVLPRIKSMAKRRAISPDKLAALFDFTSDPFTFAPIHVPGSGAADRIVKVALLVTVRSFLATGRWVGDWAEIKAMCTHQNCYDQSNFSTYLKKLKGDIFRSVEVGKNIELSASGTEKAELLIIEIAGSDATA